jgi:hypothetical protein
MIRSLKVWNIFAFVSLLLLIAPMSWGQTWNNLRSWSSERYERGPSLGRPDNIGIRLATRNPLQH